MRPLTLTLFVVAAVTSGGAAAQQQAGPDPRLEVALSMNVISQVERSVRFDKTIPPQEKPARPEFDQGEALQVREGVYVDRRLIPGGATGDEGEIRVLRRDAR